MTSPPTLTAEMVAEIHPERHGACCAYSMEVVAAMCDWIQAAVPLLRGAEWTGDESAYVTKCPSCNGGKDAAGHKPDCALAALLAGFPEGG